MSADALPTQRDLMRRLYREHEGDKAAVIAAYAKAEAEGRVARYSNDNRFDARNYAERLWSDGVRKGWIAQE